MNAPRTAVVTGAARGIGLEVARQLGQAGMRVVVAARDAAAGEAAAAGLRSEGLDASATELDVTSDVSVAAAAQQLTERFGAIDVLVNNAAAYVDWGEVPSAADLDDPRRVLETNLFGAWRVTQALLPLLRVSEGARIVNVSSGAGSHGEPQFGLAAGGGAAASYGISKAALNALTAKFAAELAPAGILVNAVDPGLTATFPGAEQMGARPVADGARSVAWAALLGDDGPTGGFFRDGSPLPW